MADVSTDQVIRWGIVGPGRIADAVAPDFAHVEGAVPVAVASRDRGRGEAFAACEFIMDYLKTEAPFWKKEQTPGGARWVDARVSDDAARAKWQLG